MSIDCLQAIQITITRADHLELDLVVGVTDIQATEILMLQQPYQGVGEVSYSE